MRPSGLALRTRLLAGMAVVAVVLVGCGGGEGTQLALDAKI